MEKTKSRREKEEEPLHIEVSWIRAPCYLSADAAAGGGWIRGASICFLLGLDGQQRPEHGDHDLSDVLQNLPVWGSWRQVDLFATGMCYKTFSSPYTHTGTHQRMVQEIKPPLPWQHKVETSFSRRNGKPLPMYEPQHLRQGGKRGLWLSNSSCSPGQWMSRS